MPTKGSREMDEIARKAVADMGMAANQFEALSEDVINPVGPHHVSRGQTGAGSDTRGKVDPGTGHAGPAEAAQEED